MSFTVIRNMVESEGQVGSVMRVDRGSFSLAGASTAPRVDYTVDNGPPRNNASLMRGPISDAPTGA